MRGIARYVKRHAPKTMIFLFVGSIVVIGFLLCGLRIYRLVQ